MKIQAIGPENFFNRITNVLTLPISARCTELTMLLARASIMELQSIFPYLIDSIFGPQSTHSWGLRTTPESMGEDFRQIRNFLSPCGPLFRSIYSLLKDTPTKYDFSLSYLPVKVKHILENVTNHPFYSDLIQVSSQSKQIIGLSLNPFDFYMFHFAYYLINPWHQRSSVNVNYEWNTVYYVLCCDYILHFLPTDPKTPVLPLINYNGKNPHQPIPQIHKLHYVPSLLSPNVLNKTLEDYTFHQNLDKHPRNEIWRSETVLTVFVDLWLCNDQINQQIQNLNSSFNNPQAMQLLHYNELPSGEYMRIVRVFIKQIHAFSISAKADDTHLGELKKITMPMVQGKFYNFIRNLVHRWPLDGSFRLVLELWLTYIQPWRYPPNSLNKHLNPKPVNPDEEDVALSSNSPVEREWLPFIVDNLLAYVVIFQQLLPRFSRVDLISPKMAIMLYRISKVFNQPNLADLLREVEHCVESNHSPSHSYNLQWSNVLPPLSPTSMWSTNILVKNVSIECNTKQLFAPDCTSTNVMCNSYFQGDKKWACILRQKMYELEGPNFCYKPLFTNPAAQEVFDVLHQVKRSMLISQDIISVKQQERAKQYSGLWGFMRSLFDANCINDDISLADRMKVPSYLEFSTQNLIDMFEIDEISEREPDSFCSSNKFNVYDDLKFLTPSKVKERIKRIKYEGDPDLQPIMTTENTFLVRVLYQLAVIINEYFGPTFNSLYGNPSFQGRLTRQLLCEPITVFNYDKSKEGSPRISKRLPPRVSFRQLASYKFLVYFIIGGLISIFFGFGTLSYTLFLLLIFIAYKCVKAIPRRHMYPTEGFVILFLTIHSDVIYLLKILFS
ncbi:hypothetical protein HHI36_007235 [Cryptolaemus montrouzieri]|uniref:Sphingomyelin phosphodiesterase 4 n=1 Tax=Cryptolaemus montrouzieri TaxID=559131 RepID=A0ABD2MP26_9CUCU